MLALAAIRRAPESSGGSAAALATILRYGFGTARRKQVEAEFEVGDAEELPFPDASFDCVITNYGHYHLPDPDRAIKEAARVLNGHYPDSCRPATMTMALALPRTREMTFRRLQIPNQRKRAIKRAPESRRAR